MRGRHEDDAANEGERFHEHGLLEEGTRLGTKFYFVKGLRVGRIPKARPRVDGGKFGGRRTCSAETIARATQEFGNRSLDRTLMMPMRYSAGLMLGDEPFGIWGPNSRHAFGHAGLINKMVWADPQREMSVAILNSGIPVIAHHLPPLINTLRSIGHRVPQLESPESFALQLG